MTFCKTQSNEPKTYIGVSGVPITLLPEIDRVNTKRARACVELLTEAIEARKAARRTRKARIKAKLKGKCK